MNPEASVNVPATLSQDGQPPASVLVNFEAGVPVSIRTKDGESLDTFLPRAAGLTIAGTQTAYVVTLDKCSTPDGIHYHLHLKK